MAKLANQLYYICSIKHRNLRSRSIVLGTKLGFSNMALGLLDHTKSFMNILESCPVDKARCLSIPQIDNAQNSSFIISGPVLPTIRTVISLMGALNIVQDI